MTAPVARACASEKLILPVRVLSGELMSTGILGLFSDERGNLRGKVIGIYILLLSANVAAWLWALAAFHDYPILMGTATLAYTFGLRHALDADHIAAIDNVTRKLMQEGKRPVAVGLFFSLGHSTIVVALSIAIAATATALQSNFDNFKNVGGVVGTLVSALFLFAIAIANILVLLSIYRTFQTVKSGGQFVEEDLDLMLANRGFLGRLFRRFFHLIERSWQMYPLGLLSALASILPQKLGFLESPQRRPRKECRSGRSSVPGIIHGGDDAPGHERQHLMLGAYGWAFVKPIRKLYYNLTITAVSVVVALVVGGFEDAQSHRRSAWLNGRRRLLGRDRRGQRQFWHPRLRHSGDFPHWLADLFHRLSRQRLRCH